MRWKAIEGSREDIIDRKRGNKEHRKVRRKEGKKKGRKERFVEEQVGRWAGT